MMPTSSSNDTTITLLSLSSVPTCSDASSCSTMAVVEGGQIVPVIPGLGKKLNALLYCTILNGDDSDCYLEACLNEGGCGKEWNFFALVNDTMPLALDGVRQAWKSIVNLFPSVLGDYMNYCVEITNTCEKFGDDSFECYQSRANTYAPNSAHDPRSLQYTGINLELRLKAEQRGHLIQDIAEGRYEYPMDMRYEWKNITIEMMKAFMQAQHMLRSLSDETVNEGMLLLDDIDASLQALLLVSDPDEIQYTSYRGVLFQIMAVVRGYSSNPAALPSSGLVLPTYSANFLIDKFGRMKDEMTYQMLGDRLTDSITTVNQDTLKLLSQNAVELVAQDAALHVKLDVAKSEMERAQQQMMNAEMKANQYKGKLEGNYRDLKTALKEYVQQERTDFFLELGKTFMTVASGDMMKLLKTDFNNIDIGSLNTILKGIKVITKLAKIVMVVKDFPSDKSAPGLPNPDGSDNDLEAYLDGSANKYQEMAKAANEALGKLGHAQFEGMVNDLIAEFAPILEIDNSGVVQTATKVIMDFKTGMAYRKDKYDATVSFASAAGRVAVATAEIVALNQALDNIKNLQEDVEAALEEQELMGTIAILQIMLSSLTSADLVGELCNAHMYVNGGDISNSIKHICGIDGGTVPSVELLEHLVEGSASLGDIVQTIGGALKTFQDAPELFHRQVPKMGTRTAMFTFANERDDIVQLVPKVDLGGFLSGEDITFTLYKGSPLLDSFTYNNFNNPMLVGYAALLDGVKIVEPDRNKYIDISLRFSRSFEVYHWELGTRTFLKPTSTEWPVSSSRPMYDDFCQYPVVVSPNSGEEFCFQTSFSNLEYPPSAKDEIFAFDSIYTSYTLSLANPEIIAEMTEEEMANLSLSVYFFYYNTIGQGPSFQALGVRELDQGPSNPEEHHPYHKSGGRLIEFREEAIGGVNILRAYDVNT